MNLVNEKREVGVANINTELFCDIGACVKGLSFRL